MSLPKLRSHQEALSACRRCPKMQAPPVQGRPVMSRILLVGQAPGDKEPLMGKPFAWTAGKTLFKWFHEASGMTEEEFRSSIFMAAVCRCFPGKKATGGDRVPDPIEITNCGHWLDLEIRLLKPSLVLPVGKLAIAQFLPITRLDEMIGQSFEATRAGHTMQVIPLPHPSGASPWHRMEPGKSLTRQALQRIVEHPDFGILKQGVRQPRN